MSRHPEHSEGSPLCDYSHVFLTQFHGKRKVLLFAPSNSVFLYRHPFTVSTNVDIGNPDFNKYPKLENLKGFTCTLNPGETLFIPSGYWHYIYYLEAGFGLSLRSQAIPVSRRLGALLNIFNLLILDNYLSKLIGPNKWNLIVSGFVSNSFAAWGYSRGHTTYRGGTCHHTSVKSGCVNGHCGTVRHGTTWRR